MREGERPRGGGGHLAGDLRGSRTPYLQNERERERRSDREGRFSQKQNSAGDLGLTTGFY